MLNLGTRLASRRIKDSGTTDEGLAVATVLTRATSSTTIG